MQPFERQIKELAERARDHFHFSSSAMPLNEAEQILVHQLCEIALATCFAVRHHSTNPQVFGETIRTKLPDEVVSFGVPFWERHNGT